MSRFFRVFSFMGQVLGMVKQNKTLLSPLGINLVVSVPAMIVFALVAHLVGGSDDGNSQLIGYGVTFIGTLILYFIDYSCNALAVSLIYDQVTTGDAKLKDAVGRTIKVAPGILIFAAISALFDMLATYARERDDIVASILIGIVRMFWTAATYVVMPAMVIEGIGFGAAFKRSKELAESNPTQVGAGVVGMGLVSYAIAFVCGALAVGSLRIMPNMFLAVFCFMFFLNLYWSLMGYLKITYFTCFYMWAKECERQGSSDPSLAPAPLANAIAS